MRTRRTLVIAISLFLSACSVLLPQSAPQEEVEGPPPGPDAAAVEQVVEVVNVGSEAAEGETGPTTVEIVGGDVAALREFVERWLGSTYPGQPANHITVYLGSLPPDLPYDLPVPEGARVIGSMGQTHFNYVQIILETPHSPEEVLAFYGQSLPEMGWETASDPGYGGGFVSADVGATYCQEGDTSLNITTGFLGTGATDVRINIFGDPGYSSCNSEERSGQDPASGVMPTLKNPPEAQMTSSGGGGRGESDAYNETQLTTDLSAGELAAYYSEQLEAAGWTLAESGESDGHAWSNWTFTDDEGQEWFGTLILLEVPPGSDTIFAYIEVAR